MAFVVGVGVCTSRPAHGACTLGTGTYSTTFTTDPYQSEFDYGRSTVAGWGSGTLTAAHAQGAFSASASNPSSGSAGLRILAAQSGKVTITPDYTLPLVYVTDTNGCQVGFWRFKNLAVGRLYDSSAVLDTASPTIIDAAASCAPGVALAVGPIDAMAVTAADKADVVVVTPKNALLEGSVANAALYIAAAAKADNTFTKVDFTGVLQAAGVAIHGGTPIALSDVDGDGRPDLLVASSHGSVNELLVFYAQAPPAATYTFEAYEVLVPNLGFSPPFADATHAVTGDGGCGPDRVGRGVTGVTRTDVDGDGIADLLLVSDDEPGIRYFRGTSARTYERQPDIQTPGATGLRQVLAYDYTGDGVVDLLAVRSGWGCKGKPGEARLLRNDGAGNFSSNNPAMVTPAANADWVVNLKNNINGTTYLPAYYQYNYGFVFGKTSFDGAYQIWNNYPAPSYYATKSTVVSKALTYPSHGIGNLVDVTVTSINKSVPANTQLTFYVSADDGGSWELLTGAELSGTPHAMQHVGQTLRWRADFAGTAKAVSGADPLYGPAAGATASLSRLQLSFRYANPQTFSMSKVGYGKVGSTEYTYAASFDTPLMHGHLNAVSLQSTVAGTAVGIQTVGGAASWDAGAQLAGSPSNARSLFAAQHKSSDAVVAGSMRGYPERRVPFTSAALNDASNTPTLAAQLDLPTNGAAAQLKLLRAGADPKGVTTLRDPGHASPSFVGAPAEDPNYMGADYARFASAQKASRTPVVLLGANDGMLHAFDATNGSERWGVVPNNALGRMRGQLGRDGNGKAIYRHQSLLEGPVTVADAYSAATGWRTVAFVGQGSGTGSDGSNYVGAVDVTDTKEPVPLWEMTEGSGGGRLCDPDPCAQQSCTSTTTSSKNPTVQNALFRGEMDVGIHLDPTDARPYALLEAEHMDAETQGTAPRGVDWRVVQSSAGAGATARGQSYITPSSAAASCTGTTLSALLGCPSATFPLYVNVLGAGTYVPMFLVYYGNTAPSFAYTVDNALGGTLSYLGTTRNTWQWAAGPAVKLSAGSHQVTVYMKDASLMLDAVAVKTAAQRIGNAAGETPNTQNTAIAGALRCSPSCLPNPSNQEWPSCGVGNKLKCCSAGGAGYCQPVASSCSAPASMAGETFSAPAVGRVRTSGGDRWVAFFGSGPSSATAYPNVGRSVYMVDALTGTPMGSWNFPAPSGSNLPEIAASVQGGVTLVDANGDGYVDRLYVGDLAGRLWKVNTSATATLNGQGSMANPNVYAKCVLFDAGDPNGTGTRRWAPIGLKPAAALLNAGRPNVYFGTGGADAAPNNVAYTFYSVQDTDALDGCMATPRRANTLLAAQKEFSVTEPAGQGRFFADPTVVDNTGVYFTSTTGNPGSINPCVAQSGTTHVYGLAIRQFIDAAGNPHPLGSSLLTGGAGYLNLNGISRAAPTVRNRPVPQVVRQSGANSKATDVLLQDNTGVVSRVSTVGVSDADALRLRVTRFRRIMDYTGN